MSKPSDSKAPAGEARTAAGVDRRRFFMMGGSAVAAAAVVPLGGGEALQTRPACGSIFSLHQHVRGPISIG